MQIRSMRSILLAQPVVRAEFQVLGDGRLECSLHQLCAPVSVVAW